MTTCRQLTEINQLNILTKKLGGINNDKNSDE